MKINGKFIDYGLPALYFDITKLQFKHQSKQEFFAIYKPKFLIQSEKPTQTKLQKSQQTTKSG
jgi:hypothetical protein